LAGQAVLCCRGGHWGGSKSTSCGGQNPGITHLARPWHPAPRGCIGLVSLWMCWPIQMRSYRRRNCGKLTAGDLPAAPVLAPWDFPPAQLLDHDPPRSPWMAKARGHAQRHLPRQSPNSAHSRRAVRTAHNEKGRRDEAYLCRRYVYTIGSSWLGGAVEMLGGGGKGGGKRQRTRSTPRARWAEFKLLCCRARVDT
jgi:hypothetical protein